MIKKTKSILIYSASLYLKNEENSSKFKLPLAEPILKEFTNKGYRIIWIFRSLSKLYNHKNNGYFTPFSSTLHGLSVKLDNIYRILNQKIINKFFNKNLYLGYFERLFWYLLLIFHKPKLVLGIETSQELCIVARSLNIKSIDLEHGLRDQDSYYFRKDYRYTTNGYPDYLFYSKSKDFNLLKNILPSYVTPIESGYIDLIHSKKKISETHTIERESYKKTILYASTYEKRGSDKPHRIPEKLIKLTQKQNLFLRIRLHPKLAQNKIVLRKALKYFEMQFDSLDFLIDKKKIIYSNPYEITLWSDIIRSCGFVTLNSSSFRQAYLLKKPVLVHSDKLNAFELESHKDCLYGFRKEIDEEIWLKFINKCLHNKNLSSGFLEEIIDIEKSKMLNALNIIYQNIESNAFISP